MRKKSVTPELQAMLDAHDQFRELRRRHLRRTRIVNGRLWLGPIANPFTGTCLLIAAGAAILGLFGLGVEVDLSTVEGAALAVIGLILLFGIGVYQVKQTRKGRQASRPMVRVLVALTSAFIAVCLIVSRDSAQVLGSLLAASAAVNLVIGVVGLIGAGLRRLFGRRSGPEELETIPGRERPAA